MATSLSISAQGVAIDLQRTKNIRQPRSPRPKLHIRVGERRGSDRQSMGMIGFVVPGCGDTEDGCCQDTINKGVAVEPQYQGNKSFRNAWGGDAVSKRLLIAMSKSCAK
jgi:hypothetical protein